MTLEMMALWWMRFEKDCRIAMFERSPRCSTSGEPDVIGVTQGRYLYEIEIKRSLSDFRANRRKPFHKIRDLGVEGPNPYPKMFWFLVPNELVEKVKPEVPKWAGLLRGPTNDNYYISSVIKAPVNSDSRRLTTKECVRLAHCMANQIFSFSRSLSENLNWDRYRGRWATGDDYEI